jgi:plasmid stabilization system protein ParE
MNLHIQRSEWFIGDLEHYAAWYDREANWEIADRYLRAVSASIERLAAMPGLGQRANFAARELRGLRFWPVKRPFHGSVDLPKRLAQSPGSENL